MTALNHTITESNYTRQEKRRALRLLSHHYGATDRLLAQREVLQIGTRPNRFFWRAILESFAWHYLHCRAFQTLCRSHNLHPSDLPSSYAPTSLPFVELPIINSTEACEAPVPDTWRSCPATAVKVSYPESAASGSSTVIQLDARSLRRLKRTWQNLGHALGLTTREKINYLNLTSEDLANTSFGLSWIPSLTRTLNSVFASPSPVHALKEFVAEGSGLRIIGDLSSTLELADKYSADLPALPGRSIIWIWDNWSKHSEFLTQHQRLAAAFKITANRIRFACPVPYMGALLVTCANGHLHLPHYLRILVRDTATLQPLSQGKGGRLQLISPCLSSQATPSVLTQQKGIVRLNCPCGISAPYLELQTNDQ